MRRCSLPLPLPRSHQDHSRLAFCGTVRLIHCTPVWLCGVEREEREKQPRRGRWADDDGDQSSVPSCQTATRRGLQQHLTPASREWKHSSCRCSVDDAREWQGRVALWVPDMLPTAPTAHAALWGTGYLGLFPDFRARWSGMAPWPGILGIHPATAGSQSRPTTANQAALVPNMPPSRRCTWEAPQNWPDGGAQSLDPGQHDMRLQRGRRWAWSGLIPRQCSSCWEGCTSLRSVLLVLLLFYSTNKSCTGSFSTLLL